VVRERTAFGNGSDSLRCKMRVLVVDDDELSRELLEMMLVRAGHAVETVDGGAEALAALRSAGGGFDALLVDVQMPGISGSELAARLRDVGRGARLLAMSASVPAEDVLAGFDGFLKKPFAAAAFEEAVAAGSVVALRAASVVDDEDAAAQVLDDAVYAKLAGSMRAEKLEQLYAMCVSDVRRRVELMRSAAASGDDAAYRREAHAIKGGCGLVGAGELQSIAALEENAGIHANHVATLNEFALAVERLERMLVANKRRTESNTVVAP